MKTVKIRWIDGYLEEFECNEIRFSGGLLWMKIDGKNMHIPLYRVRYFLIS